MVVSCSDDTFGKKENLILPGYTNLDGCHGWVTKRKNNLSPSDLDWSIIKLCEAGHLKKAVIETIGLDGLEPVTAALYACRSDNLNPDFPKPINWYKISSDVNLEANKSTTVDLNLSDDLFTHVKLIIAPDGGISRLRLFDHEPVSENHLSDFVEVSKSEIIESEIISKTSVPINPSKRNIDDTQALELKTSTETEKSLPSNNELPIPSEIIPIESESKSENVSTSTVDSIPNKTFLNRIIATPKRPSAKRPIILQSPVDNSLANSTNNSIPKKPLSVFSSVLSPTDNSNLTKKPKKSTKDEYGDSPAIPTTQAVKKSSKNKKSKKAIKSQLD
ncbi:hypothetical protein BB561_004048 [Smittium simulii]|uniref:Allantoicase domain-containing protein n=1 Tax=Smittium simulii TaxID=133385 RepID=A0A2T9YIF4_9FUNG|nr:hypothetical protein BB561_004048 [Smittium simulii]